jgi:hypothetical protein
MMIRPLPHDILLWGLLGTIGLGVVLYLGGLSTTLQLGNAQVQGVLLVPALPTSLYITMALVVCAGVGITLVVSFVQRQRKPLEPQRQRESTLPRAPWQVFLHLLAWAVLCALGVRWLMQHGAEVLQWWEQWSHELETLPDLLAVNTRSLFRQVDSPAAGYTLFLVVIIVYGGLAALGIWVLCTDREPAGALAPQEHPRTRQVRRAVTAGLQALQQHTEARQAIIACYARLEHLLEDHGVPAHQALTPQEYMGAALQGLDLPVAAFAGLVALFEQARYSVHPLDDTARTLAIAHLAAIKHHLEGEPAGATLV